jgi:hypothetical protein
MTNQDLYLITDYARTAYLEQPNHPRLPGASREMDDSERRCAAYYNAVLQFLNSKGVVKDAESLGISFQTENYGE